MISGWRSREHSYPAIIATGFLVFMAVTGALLGGKDGVAYVATAGVLWFPAMAGWFLRGRKKETELLGQIRALLAERDAGEPEPLAVVRQFPGAH